MTKCTFRELGKISAVDVVVGLQENLSKTRLADRVILQVELVKPVERVLVGVHV